jgi:hypothetical protein
MIDVPAIKAFIESLDSEYAAIDDGGLTLIGVDRSGRQTGAYLEVADSRSPRTTPSRNPGVGNSNSQSRTERTG